MHWIPEKHLEIGLLENLVCRNHIGNIVVIHLYQPKKKKQTNEESGNVIRTSESKDIRE